MQVKGFHLRQGVEDCRCLLLGVFAVQPEHDLKIIVAILDQRRHHVILNSVVRLPRQIGPDLNAVHHLCARFAAVEVGGKLFRVLLQAHFRVGPGELIDVKIHLRVGAEVIGDLIGLHFIDGYLAVAVRARYPYGIVGRSQLQLHKLGVGSFLRPRNVFFLGGGGGLRIRGGAPDEGRRREQEDHEDDPQAGVQHVFHSHLILFCAPCVPCGYRGNRSPLMGWMPFSKRIL